MGSLAGGLRFMQVEQRFTNSSTCLDTPGYHTDDVMRRRHLWFP